MQNPYDLTKPFFVLAPMDEVTDTVFRQMVVRLGAPDLFFTEFVNVEGLMHPEGRKQLLKKLRSVPEEGKVIVQIWGINPENFCEIAKQIADGSIARELSLADGFQFAGIDINMGCPAKSEVRAGTCSALIRRENWQLASAIIKATQEGSAGRLPVSVKTRVGFSAVDMEWFDFLLSHELDMLTVHGRTRKQMSKAPADWSLIAAVRQKRDDRGLKTLIVGNGDVMSRQQGEDLAAEHQLDGIMIGRGIFHDPFVFTNAEPLGEHLDHLEVIPIGYGGDRGRLELFRQHVKLFAETWRPDERPIVTLNKFCKMYIQGFDGAAALREKLMKSKSTDELLAIMPKETR